VLLGCGEDVPRHLLVISHQFPCNDYMHWDIGAQGLVMSTSGRSGGRLVQDRSVVVHLQRGWLQPELEERVTGIPGGLLCFFP
jgi:hypothetical protein